MSNCKVDSSVKQVINELFYVNRKSKGYIKRELNLSIPTINKHIDKDYLKKNVEKVNGKWCVLHGHPQKPGSARDKPIGTPIHCYPGTDEGRKRAYAMHYAITQEQEKKGDENMVEKREGKPPKDWWDKVHSAVSKIPEVDDPAALTMWIWQNKKMAKGSIKDMLQSIVDFDKVKKERERNAIAKLLGLDKAETSAMSRSSGYQNPKYGKDEEEEDEKACKPKKKSELEQKMDELKEKLDNTDNPTTVCDVLDEVWKSLEDTESKSKVIIFKEDFIPGYKLTLLSDKHEIFNGTGAGGPLKQLPPDHTFEDHLSKSFEDIGEVKPNDLIIGGYATTEDIDADNEVVEKEAAYDAFSRWIQKDKYTNIMLMHQNLQVGDPVRSVKIDNKEYKTHMDNIGLYLITKIRGDDEEEIQEVRKDIQRRKLKAYSLGGRALQKERVCTATQCADHIKKLNLWEWTICEKGKNPRSGFEILHAPENWNN